MTPESAKVIIGKGRILDKNGNLKEEFAIEVEMETSRSGGVSYMNLVDEVLNGSDALDSSKECDG
jgi:pyruvate/oxaloacetate carboxyltransferase